MAVDHVLAAVDLPLNAASGVPASLLGQRHIAEATAGLAGDSVVGGAALNVAGDEEADEEVCQRGQVQDVQPDGKGLVGGGDARLGDVGGLGDESSLLGRAGGGRVQGGGAEEELLKRVQGARGGGQGGLGRRRLRRHLGDGDGSDKGDEGVDDGVRGPEHELGDLHGGEGALDGHGHLDREGRQGVVRVHEGVDEGVDEDEDPDGDGHVADARPHAEHGAGVVVRLQGGAELALGEDDEGVEDLVELAQVEDPAVVAQPFVPHASHLEVAGAAGAAQAAQEGAGVRAVPPAGRVVEEQRAAEPGRPVDAAEAVGRGSDAAGAERADDGAAHAAQHAPEGPGRVDGQENVVEDDKGEEGPRLAHGPGLLAARGVEPVQCLGGDGVQGRHGQGDLGVERGLEDAVGDVEGAHDARGHRRRRQRLRRIARREDEEAGIRHRGH